MQALTIKNLTKTYDGGVQALNDISFNVEAGDFFALLGPNGAGKSTTIGVVTSLVSPSGGDVTVFGYDLIKQKDLVKQQIGLVPQEFNFNVFEKVLDIVVNQGGYYGLPRKLATERAEKYLRQLELWEKRFATARELSGGMKRRLMIARALVHEPKLLILDEPTAGVDIEIRQTMWKFLEEINKQGTTIILTTHYLEEAENLCRNIAIIDHGTIIENTSMRELLDKLNQETFVLYLKEPIDEAPKIEDVTIRHIDEMTLEVDLEKNSVMNEIFTELSMQDIHITSMRNKANRLEALFLGMIKKNEKK